MNIDFNRFTEMASKSVQEAQNEARRRNNQQVDGWHLLHALITQEHGTVPAILEKMNVQPSAAQLAVDRQLERLPSVQGSAAAGQMYITQLVQDTFNRAEEIAGQLKDEFISVEHLSLGLMKAGGGPDYQRFFQCFDLTEKNFLEAMREVRGNQRVTS